MKLYVEYAVSGERTYKAWVQIPVSNDNYPQEYIEVYIAPQRTDKPLYPESGISIIVGWFFVGIFYVLGIFTFFYYVIVKV